MHSLKSLFLIDPDVVFLNHGSFGATPRPVFETYQAWQRQLERQPVAFIGRELTGYLQTARQALGSYLNAPPDDLVYIPNATYGLNVVAHSLPLGAGDEVLTTNHEYGACDNTWQFYSERRGFTYVRQPIALPVGNDAALIAQLWQGVTPRTKVIFLSHITSATAVTFPIAAICERARAEGIRTVIDGAHAPGQIDLDLSAIAPDFYFGNCHKWLCAPKGAAFLYTRPAQQHLIEPLIVSWGWGANRSETTGSDYLDFLQWTGTNDVSAYLSVPAAIEFQQQHNWTAVRQQCHELLKTAVAHIHTHTGLPMFYASPSFYHQMAVVPLPPIADLLAFKTRLYDQYRIELPCTQLGSQQFMRISIQGYNTEADVAALLAAVRREVPSA